MDQPRLMASGDERLRIAVFTFAYAPVITGVAIGVHYRVRRLVELGHEVLLIHPEIDEQYPEDVRTRQMPGLEQMEGYDNFRSTTYPTRPHLFTKTHPEPRHHRHWDDTQLLVEFDPDIVLVEDGAGMRGLSSLFYGGYGRPVGVDYANQTDTPAVVMFETDWFSYAERYLGRLVSRIAQPLLVKLVSRFSRAYTTTFFPSHYQLRKYRQLGVIPSEHFHFHGVDCQEFEPENIRFDPIPNDNRPTLLFVGRIAPEKNTAQLLDAFRLIQSEVSNAHLVIVGTGPQSNTLRRRAKTYGDSVTFWGESFGDELKGLFARADVYLNPSVTENFCTTNLESFASGTPVVAADAGGNSEQIIDGVNGFLATPNQPSDLARKAITVLSDCKLRDQLSEQARESVLQFDNDACTDRLVMNLKSLIATSRRGESNDAVDRYELPSSING